MAKGGAHAEIARRYARKADRPPVSIASIRIAELRRLFSARYGRVLPADDSGMDDALIMAHHICRRPGDHPKLIAAWLSLWAPWMPGEQVAIMITAVTANPIRWRADKLGQRLGLTDAERHRLQICTIGSIDVTKAERASRRRESKRQRKQQRRRAEGAKPRAEYEAKSLSRTKPWQALGISRATWYRTRKGVENNRVAACQRNG